MTDSELREIINPLFVPCPACEAMRGLPCRNNAYKTLAIPHYEREKESIRRAKEILPFEIAD